jgi:hypothetical protein
MKSRHRPCILEVASIDDIFNWEYTIRNTLAMTWKERTSLLMCDFAETVSTLSPRSRVQYFTRFVVRDGKSHGSYAMLMAPAFLVSTTLISARYLFLTGGNLALAVK